MPQVPTLMFGKIFEHFFNFFVLNLKMYLSLHISAQQDQILTYHLSISLVYIWNFGANSVDEWEDFTRKER